MCIFLHRTVPKISQHYLVIFEGETIFICMRVEREAKNGRSDAED